MKKSVVLTLVVFVLVTANIGLGQQDQHKKPAEPRFKLRTSFSAAGMPALAGFDPAGLVLFEKATFDSRLGEWVFYWNETDGQYGGVLTSPGTFNGVEGKDYSLMHNRQVTLSEAPNRIGFGLDARVFPRVWLTFEFFQPGKKAIFSFEELDTFRFEELTRDESANYWYYSYRVSRKLKNQIAKAELSANSFQFGLKWFVFQNPYSGLALQAGLDYWRIAQKTSISQKTYPLLPWAGKISGKISSQEEIRTERREICRPFVGTEIELEFGAGLKLALAYRLFFGGRNVAFKSNNLLISESAAQFWELKLPKSALVFALSKAF